MKVITDVFPLRDKQAPAGKYLGLGDATIDQALEPAHGFLERQVPGTPNTSDTDEEYLVEAILDSVYHDPHIDEYEYKVSWVGYDASVTCGSWRQSLQTAMRPSVSIGLTTHMHAWLRGHLQQL